MSKKEIIYNRELHLEKMFAGPGRYQTFTIVTYVVKSKGWFGRYDYEIKQTLPLTTDPFYDGDFATNRIIERHGVTERALAEKAIEEDQIKRKENNNG